MNDVEHTRLAAVEDRLWHFAALHGNLRRGLARGGWNGQGALLDAGCGTGGFLRRLGVWFPAAARRGIDFSPLAVELARGRAGCAVEQGSVLALPFADGAFDAITCADVVYQFERPGDAYREFARCLKPGGVLAVNEPAFRWLWSYHDDRVGGRHRFTRRELSTLLRAAGLTPVYATYWNALALPLIWARRRFGAADAESDVREYPWWVSLPMRALLACERGWLATGLTFPAGTSVLAVAVKNLEPAEAPRHT